MWLKTRISADLQIEHDSGGLPHGVDSEQQALHHQGYFRCGRRGRRCRDLHRHRRRGQCQGIHLRVRGGVLHLAATDCELLSLFIITIFHAELLHCVFLAYDVKNSSYSTMCNDISMRSYKFEL